MYLGSVWQTVLPTTQTHRSNQTCDTFDCEASCRRPAHFDHLDAQCAMINAKADLSSAQTSLILNVRSATNSEKHFLAVPRMVVLPSEQTRVLCKHDTKMWRQHFPIRADSMQRTNTRSLAVPRTVVLTTAQTWIPGEVCHAH